MNSYNEDFWKALDELNKRAKTITISKDDAEGGEIIYLTGNEENGVYTESVSISPDGTLSISSGIPGEPGYREKIFRSIRDAALGNAPITDLDENF